MTTDRERLEENAEDAVIALLMNDLAESEGAYYMAENERLRNDPAAAVPEDVERRALQLIERETAKQKNVHSGGRVLRFAGRVLIAALVAVLLFTAAYALSPAVRSVTLNFLMQLDSQLAAWQFEAVGDDGAGLISGQESDFEIVVNWLPEGYTRQPAFVFTPTDVVQDYMNEDGNLIRVSVHASEDFIHTLDLEDADYFSEISIQETAGLLIEKHGTVTIGWVYNDTELVVSVESKNEDATTLIGVAESIQLID